MMKYAEELTTSLNRATAASVGSAAVLTWFFSAMQCNKEHCFTTDNPIVQVAFAGALAISAVMVATSAPVLEKIQPLAKPITEKINHAKTYLNGIFASQKTEESKKQAPDATLINTTKNLDVETLGTPTQSGSNLVSPERASIQANASETSPSSNRSHSPSA